MFLVESTRFLQDKVTINIERFCLEKISKKLVKPLKKIFHINNQIKGFRRPTADVSRTCDFLNYKHSSFTYFLLYFNVIFGYCVNVHIYEISY